MAAPIKPHIGLDVKFTPDANNAIDFTVKPDFSQVESDTAQISANERFARPTNTHDAKSCGTVDESFGPGRIALPPPASSVTSAV